VLGQCVLGQCILGKGVLGQCILGKGVLGQCVLGQCVLGQCVLGQCILGKGILGQCVLGQDRLGYNGSAGSHVRRDVCPLGCCQAADQRFLLNGHGVILRLTFDCLTDRLPLEHG